MTLKLISTVEVGSGGAATIDFTSIPQTYTDLVLVTSARTTTNIASNGYYFLVKPNGSSSNGTFRTLYGTGSGVGSGGGSVIFVEANPTDYTSNTFSNSSIYIPNYAGSTFKSISSDVVLENNGTATSMTIAAQLWSSTSAITSITLTPGGGNFAQYSTASLYGIQKGSGGATVA